MKKYLAPLSVLLLGLFSYAQQTCIYGEPKESNLVSQLTEASFNSEITQIINRQYNLVTTQAQDCQECHTASERTNSTQLSALEKIPNAPKLLFNMSCLIESSRFKAAAPEISCPDGHKSTNRNICLNEDFLKYENAVLSSFASCANKENFISLDPQFLYRLYSLESGFKPQYVSAAGTGLGQVTRIFIDDIHQKHRGYKYLKRIAESANPECNAAKVIAKIDLNKKPPHKNSCDFTMAGEGLERNMLYSFIGLANSWEKDIQPKLRPYLKKHATDPKIEEIKNLVLMLSYGAGGRAEARATIRRLSHLSPEKFLAALKKPLISKSNRDFTRYIRNSETRANQIAQKFTEPLKSQYKQIGAQACVNSY